MDEHSSHSRTLLPMKPPPIPADTPCRSDALCLHEESTRRTMPGGMPRESLGDAVLRELCVGAATEGIPQRQPPALQALAPGLREVYCRIGERLFGMGLDAARAELEEARSAREDAFALVADLLAGSPEAIRRARALLERPTMPDVEGSPVDRATTPDEIDVDMEMSDG